MATDMVRSGGLWPPDTRALTSIRFFAAGLVVCNHFAIDLPGMPSPAEHLFANGYVGVSLFFVLSGFILAFKYVDVEAPIPRRAFWAARAARVYPIYALALVLAMALLAARIGARPASNTWAAFAAAVMLVQAWMPPLVSGPNPPAWTLSVEAFLYLLLPFVARPIARWAMRYPVIVVVSLWGLGSAVALAGDALYDRSIISWDAFTFLLNSPGLHSLQFMIGVVVAVVAKGRRIRLPAGTAWIFAMFAIAVLAVVPRETHRLLLNDGVLSPAFAGLILALLAAPTGTGRWIASRPAVLLGDASYAMYILQVPVWGVSTAVRWTNPWTHFIVYVIALLGLSIAMLIFFERPARRRLRRWLAPPEAQAPKARQA